MKKIFLLTSLLMAVALLQANAQEKETTIKVRIEDNGKLIEKTYNSEEALENDPELKELGIEVEAEDGRIQVHNKGNSKVMISQHSGGGNGNVFIYQSGAGANFFADSIPFPAIPPHPALPPHIIRMDSVDFVFSDSLGEMPSVAFFRMQDHRGELDSLMEGMMHKRFEMRIMRDSLRHGRLQEMRTAQKEMRAEMQEMRQQMQELRRQLREERQYIVIENLSREEAEELNVEKQELRLEDLQFYPNPSDGQLRVKFEAPENSPVQLRLTDTAGRTILEKSSSPANGRLEENIELEGQESGIYILHIIQDGQMLSRKIMLK
ncbi:T9SS type A sorting domain-containing protein [Nafulsella turpanensis]|uniref:T9SS type A sorting domain-containing protein n=1 Tax=Nafulsella turpanensis TaxID=1265690 RepID=UPI00034945C4|nr:T9SS type A sorting domain-containing protein [Nafulsella turpanensis]